jgi:hypothetical protein
MEQILFMHQKLRGEGKKSREACRIIANHLQTSVTSVEGILRRLKRENKIQANVQIVEPEEMAPEARAHIIERRGELAFEGRTESDISMIIAGELGLSQKCVWNKIQHLIRQGSIPNKRELARARRRSYSFQLAEHEKRENLRKERPIKKKEEEPPRPAERHDTEIEKLLEKSREVREGIFVRVTPEFVPECRVSTVMGFAQSRIGEIPRLRRERQGDETKCYFSLTRTTSIEAKVSGDAVYFKKSSIPAVLFAAAMQNGSHSEAMGEIGALAREISENSLLFPRRVPSWLELKIWVARAFCSENADNGANSERMQKIEKAIPFSRLAAFFGHTQKAYLEIRSMEAEPDSSAHLASWRRHSSLYR